jgi:uncharacterized membrane protein YccF (DUF307 family)
MRMSFAGNLLWFVFGGGFFAFLGWILTGLLLAITVIGIPFAIAAFRIAAFAAFPFGRELVDVSVLGKERIIGTAFANLLWILLAGLWLAIGHAIMGLTCFVSIIGIPFGLAHFKLAGVCFAPLGKEAVPVDVARAARKRDAESRVAV